MKLIFKYLFLPSYISQRKIIAERERRTREANERFNIHRIDGVDFITYNGVIVSSPDDNDLIARLEYFRTQYINK